MNVGREFISSKNGLITTVAATMNGEVEYALEGSIFVGGAVIQWLRDELRILETAAESETYAASLEDNGGVYLVPAFNKFSADIHQQKTACAVSILCRPFGKASLTKQRRLLITGNPRYGYLNALALNYQTNDVLQAMAEDAGQAVTELKVDGGACRNDFLMQYLLPIGRFIILCVHLHRCNHKFFHSNAPYSVQCIALLVRAATIF